MFSDKKFAKKKLESKLSHTFAQKLTIHAIEIVTGTECDPTDFVIETQLLKFDPGIQGHRLVEDDRAIMRVDVLMNWIDPHAINAGSRWAAAQFYIEQSESKHGDRLWRHYHAGSGSLSIDRFLYSIAANERSIRPTIEISSVEGGCIVRPFGKGTCLTDRQVY